MNSSDNLSHAVSDELSQAAGMTRQTGAGGAIKLLKPKAQRGMRASDYNSEFIRRTKEAREQAHFSQEQISTILGIEQSTYKWYEIRTPLPHRFVPAFCAATRVTETWLFGGAPKR